MYIIILNFNQKHLTEACINSIKNNTFKNYKIIIVDNGSKDMSAQYLKKLFKDSIHIIQNKYNYGFARGNNIGIRYALKSGANYVLLLNNDTILSERCLEKLYAVSQRYKNYSFYCPKIYYYDKPNTIWYAGGEVDLNKPKGVIHYGFNKIIYNDYNKNREISFATGWAILFPVNTLKKIGLFDENFFIYCEDIDISLRIKKMWGIGLYVYDSILWHKVGQTFININKQLKRLYLFTRNRFIVQRREVSLVKNIIFIFKYLLSNETRKAIYSTIKFNYMPIYCIYLGIVDGIKNNRINSYFGKT